MPTKGLSEYPSLNSEEGYSSSSSDSLATRVSKAQITFNLRSWSQICLLIIAAVQTVALVFAVATLKRMEQSQAPEILLQPPSIRPEFRQQIYSPAHAALEYETRVFTTGHDEQKTPYQGPPGDETDKVWGKLYNNTILTISPEEALNLPNHTHPFGEDNSRYLMHIDVFHQLHCLNTIRRALHKDFYLARGAEDLEDEHVSHCVDSVRQSLMCSSDIGSLVWQWRPAAQTVQGRTDIVHSCRNFDKLREWTLKRRVHSWFDQQTFYPGWDDIYRNGKQQPLGHHHF